MATSFEIRDLEGPFGAEILGWDATSQPAEDTTHAWHAALDGHQLLVFRDLELDAEGHVALAATLGPPLIENDSGRAYQFVSNTHEEGILGDERFAFHSDHAFMEDPIEIISLYGLEIPKAGSQTRFVNCALAAKKMPASLQESVSGRSARHIIDPAAESGAVAFRGPRRKDSLPHAYHPILWDGARRKAPVLYVSEQQTDLVEGLDGEESDALIEKLFAHLYSGDFTYVHEWREGDLVVWDNRALQHARDAIPNAARRNLRRVSVGGTAVHEYFRKHTKWGLEEFSSAEKG